MLGAAIVVTSLIQLTIRIRYLDTCQWMPKHEKQTVDKTHDNSNTTTNAHLHRTHCALEL